MYWATGLHDEGGTCIMPWELSQSAKPSPTLSLSLSSFSTTYMGPKCSTLVDYWPVMVEGWRSHKGPKKKKEKESDICFEKKGASQTGKAPPPPPPQMTPKGQPRGNHFFAQRRLGSGKTAISVPLGGWGRRQTMAWHSIVRRCHDTLTARAYRRSRTIIYGRSRCVDGNRQVGSLPPPWVHVHPGGQNPMKKTERERASMTEGGNIRTSKSNERKL
ncbi:hypothetical protein LX36DRAFT_74173 [Colletotrichum falcatum]|nr:hypothetical protein LX36DRAFT_74173 [Colletotrichum falcatum]